MSLNEIRKNVERLLSEHERLRNDDIALLLAYWKNIDGANIKIITQKPFTNLMSIIQRRQELQANIKFIPTNLKTRLKRGK